MHLDPLSALIAKRLGGSEGSLPDDPESREALPILWSFLTRRDVDGNLAKEPATINIRLGLGSWIVTLTDPSLEVSLTTVVPALRSSIEHLEEAASRTDAPWAPWKGSVGKFSKVNKSSSTREHLSSNDSPGGERRNGAP